MTDDKYILETPAEQAVFNALRPIAQHLVEEQKITSDKIQRELIDELAYFGMFVARFPSGEPYAGFGEGEASFAISVLAELEIDYRVEMGTLELGGEDEPDLHNAKEAIRGALEGGITKAVRAIQLAPEIPVIDR